MGIRKDRPGDCLTSRRKVSSGAASELTGNRSIFVASQSIRQRLQQRIPAILIELDVQLRGHVVGQVE